MSDKISVGCKLPSGLIVDHEGERVHFKGTKDANNVGGYGVTENVDAEWFAHWSATHSEFPAIRNQLIFAETTKARARDRAREQAAVTNGFEGVDPEKPAVTSGVTGIVPVDDKDKK